MKRRGFSLESRRRREQILARLLVQAFSLLVIAVFSDSNFKDLPWICYRSREERNVSFGFVNSKAVFETDHTVDKTRTHLNKWLGGAALKIKMTHLQTKRRYLLNNFHSAK